MIPLSARRLLVPAGLAAVAALAGCLPSVSYEPRRLENVAIPVEDTRPKAPPPVEVREEPPPTAAARPFRFPPPTWAELPGGIKLATVARGGLPVVEVRVVIPGGAAADGERPGVAALTAELLREGGAGALSGRDLLARIEALGASLTAEATLDAIILRLSAPSAALEPALALLGQVVLRPRLGPPALESLKRRAIARLNERTREDGAWAARTMLHRELYLLPTERHPYSSAAPSATELQKITAADCRAFHERQLSPARLVVVIAGDVTPEAARAAAEPAFAGAPRRRSEPADPSLTDPVPPESLKITLVDLPGAARSEIDLAFIGPARGDREWPAFALAGQLLGAAEPLRVARGPVPLVVHASAPASQTGPAVQALLDRLEGIATTGAQPDEVEAAAKQAAAALAVRLETAAALADELATLKLGGLPDDYHEGLRREQREMPAALVGKVAGELLRPAHGVLVVAGDAEKIGPVLAHFGQVKVVDPGRDFERRKTLPANPEAPLTVE